MSVYKNSGSVSDVKFKYTSSLIDHGLSSSQSFERVVPNCQVHQVGLYTIEIKVAYSDIANCNCCNYDGYWYRIVDYNQSSTNYGTVTCEFSPLLSFLFCDRTGMSGVALSTITKNPYLATSINSYPTVEQLGKKKTDVIKLAGGDPRAVEPMAFYVAMSLPATMVNIDATATTLSDWTSRAPNDTTSPSYYQNTGVIILHCDINSDDHGLGASLQSIVDGLTIIASDPLWVGCVVDAWIDCVDGDTEEGGQINFNTSSTYGVSGFPDSLSMYPIRRKPQVLAKVSIPRGNYPNSRLYNSTIDITYGGESVSIPLSELELKLTTEYSVYDGHLLVMYYPAISSQGGEFTVVFKPSEVNDDTGRVILLHSVNKPVIGLQAGINAGASYWQQNKSRYELGQDINIAETLYGVLVGAFTGAGKSLSAMSAGFLKGFINKATKDAIITDNSRISTGVSGGGHMWVNPYWSVILSVTNDDDLDNYLKSNPLTTYKAWNITDNGVNDVIRLSKDNSSTIPTWVQGNFNIPNLPTGYKKQRVLSMLQQGVCVNYNTGIGYQEG